MSFDRQKKKMILTVKSKFFSSAADKTLSGRVGLAVSIHCP
jgi:hypothetical protein